MKTSKPTKERGAALVEMAMVMPLFILLLFGIMETGWLFSQQVEVRHGAREAARIAAVSTPEVNASPFDASDIRDRACQTMDLSNGAVTSIDLADGGGDIGDNATVTITVGYQSLTGILDSIFGSLTIDTAVDFRLEQPALWSSVTFTAVPPLSVCP